MRPSLTRPAILVLMVLLAAPWTGYAERTEADCDLEYVRGVGNACRLDNGLLRIVLPSGLVQTTHGPDPYLPDEGVGTLSSHERDPVCATDWYQHVFYAYPADRPDRYAASVATIRTAIKRMNALLDQDGLASGGVTADYKVLCTSDGQIKVDKFVVPSSSGDFDAIVAAAQAAGFTSARADHTIFYDGDETGLCGVGHIAYDERLAESNANNQGGDYAVTYRSCWTGRTPMHENGHNQGAVQRTAPDSDLAGHCLEGRDIMCYPTSSVLVLCRDRDHFDCDFDTYFDAAPEPGEWLASHWNIGSRLNRFIVFDGQYTPSNQAPLPAFTTAIEGFSVSVDASGTTDLDGDDITFSWAFGDGTTASGPTAQHTYEASGIYTVTLVATDEHGAAATLRKEVTTEIDVAPATDTVVFRGEVSCSFARRPVETTDACDMGSTDHGFSIPPGATGLHVALVWDTRDAGADGRLAAETMRYRILEPPALGEKEGTSPVVGDHPVAVTHELYVRGGDLLLHVRPTGDSALVVDQPYTLCVTVLYGGHPLPPDLSCS